MEKQLKQANKEKNTGEGARLEKMLKMRAGFVSALKDAKITATNITDSAVRKKTKGDLKAFGKEQDGNGITIAEKVSVPGASSGEVGFTRESPGGIVVAFDASEFTSESMFISIAHEGSHVGDILYNRMAGETSTRSETEGRAYMVSSMMAEAGRVGSLKLTTGTLLWSSSWAKADLPELRKAAVSEALKTTGDSAETKRGQEQAFRGGAWR